jgi:hypothetical protein
MAAAQVGQGTAWICFRVSSLVFIVPIMERSKAGMLLNIAHDYPMVTYGVSQAKRSWSQGMQ